MSSTERSRKHRAKKTASELDSTKDGHATPCNAMQRQETPREEKRREEEKLSDRSTHTTTSSAVDGLVAYEGTFDGHEGSQAITPNQVAPFAIALTKAGVRVTTLNPELIAYQQEGGSVDHLMQLVQMDEFCGKPAGYVLKAARRELAEKPSGIRLSIHPYQSRPVSNTEQGLVGLERLKKRPRT